MAKWIIEIKQLDGEKHYFTEGYIAGINQVYVVQATKNKKKAFEFDSKKSAQNELDDIASEFYFETLTVKKL